MINLCARVCALQLLVGVTRVVVNFMLSVFIVCVYLYLCVESLPGCMCVSESVCKCVLLLLFMHLC